MPAIPHRLGNFETVRQIGCGMGMRIVYEALQISINRNGSDCIR